MADPNRALFESVVHLLAPVLDELVFVGGCTTGLFITDPAAGGIRPTKDVDAIVDVTSYAPYTALTERLRALGLGEDTTPGAPLCRWRHGHLIVDVMPTDATVLGFSNRWYPTAVETARTLQISGHDVRVVTPALFIATKLEAFHAMTSSRAMTSRTSSRSSMAVLRFVGDVAAASDDVRAYIGAEIGALLDNRDFTEALLEGVDVARNDTRQRGTRTAFRRLNSADESVMRGVARALSDCLGQARAASVGAR